MRKLTILLLLVGLMSASVLPAFAQQAICYRRAKGEKVHKPVSQPAGQATREAQVRSRRQAAQSENYADFKSVKASASPDGGAKVEWEMNSETGNVGFEIYKATDAGRELVSDQVIAGSAIKSLTEPFYGTTYSWIDPNGTAGTAYIVVALGQSGQEIPSDPVQTVVADEETSAEIAARSAASLTNPGILESTFPKVKPSLRESVNDLSTQRWVAAQPGAKIAIRAEGFYRVRFSELQNAVAGVFTAANTANWRLFRDGVEQAAIIGADQNGPYVEFYGRPIDTAESDTHIYYLLVDPAQVGLRVGRSRGGRPDGTPLSSNYVATTSFKERTQYLADILNNRENWWGRFVTASGVNVPVSLSNVDQNAGNATLTVRMQAWIPGNALPNTQVTLNGTVLGTINAQNYKTASSNQFTVPANLIHSGSNTLRLTALSGGFDLFDSYSLDYGRIYATSQNSLALTVPDQKSVSITGFTSSNIRVFLMGAGDNLTQVERLGIQQAGATYTANLPASGHVGQTKLFAIENSAILQASSVTANTPSQLTSLTTNPGPVDMIIISHSAPDFMAAANAWGNYRTGQGFNVVVADVADVMDEFNYGSSSSAAIHDFLEYAHTNWLPVSQKQYVLLLGDASVDPRNYTGLPTGSANLVPTVIAYTSDQGETASDDALADFNSDALPEMAVGRIPTRTANVITRILDKTSVFEASTALQDPSRGVLFAYDRPKDWNFGMTSHNIADQLSSGVPKTFVHRGVEPTPPENELAVDPNSTTNLVNAMNGNNYMVVYSGHGAGAFWSDAPSSGDPFNYFLKTTIITQQVSTPNPSIFVMFTCYTSNFMSPGQIGNPEETISETLMNNPNAGGPAAWGSSAATTADVQEMMGTRFMSHINAGDIPRMGDLVRDAKMAVSSNSDVRVSWILFGDPMLKVR